VLIPGGAVPFIAALALAASSLARSRDAHALSFENKITENGERLIWLEPRGRPAEGPAWAGRGLERRHDCGGGRGLSQAAEKPVRAFAQLCAAIRNDPRSVEAIALASGVDRNTLWLWVDGRTTNPNIAQVDKVARALGFSLELSPPPAERRKSHRARRAEAH
jgi:DNA-binding phage protein